MAAREESSPLASGMYNPILPVPAPVAEICPSTRNEIGLCDAVATTVKSGPLETRQVVFTPFSPSNRVAPFPVTAALSGGGSPMPASTPWGTAHAPDPNTRMRTPALKAGGGETSSFEHVSLGPHWSVPSQVPLP